MAHIVEPTIRRDQSLERTAGWLGGLYDGEGSYHFIAQYEKVNDEVRKRIEEAAKELEIPLTSTPRGYCITGGCQGYVDFLNVVQPTKRHQLESFVIGKKPNSKADRIMSVEPDGCGEVTCLMTTTGNYVVWGYASRNSTSAGLDPRVVGKWPASTFELIYDSFVRREVLDTLEQERRARVNAVFSNGGYLQGGEEGAKLRKKELEHIQQEFEEARDNILNPYREVDLEANPMYAAGMRQLDKLKWDIMSGAVEL